MMEKQSTLVSFKVVHKVVIISRNLELSTMINRSQKFDCEN